MKIGRLVLTRKHLEQTTIIVGGKEIKLTTLLFDGKCKQVWEAEDDVRIVRTEIIERLIA